MSPMRWLRYYQISEITILTESGDNHVIRKNICSLVEPFSAFTSFTAVMRRTREWTYSHSV
ncbi:MAG: hypothetical protein ACYDBK_07535 [Thermoplasmataceae archaeon]